MSQHTYRINEIFYSIQGEGTWTGMPAIFIRFSGCNLKCSWCDTDFKKSKLYSLNDIMDELAEIPCRDVVLTGGEPMLQTDERLLSRLVLHHRVHVETNGTIAIPDKLRCLIFHLCVSPKPDAPWNQYEGDALKIVYTGQELDNYVKRGIFSERFLQPCSLLNTEECIQKCLEDPRWQLSVQLHRMLNLR